MRIKSNQIKSKFIYILKMWASLGEKRNNSLEESPSPHIRGITVETHKDVKTLSENKLARYIHEKKILTQILSRNHTSALQQ